jgi:hypothetical protein
MKPTIWSAFLDWLTKYEAFAIWLEGIALLLIFIWDRKDAGEAREESARQLAVSRDQVEATHRPFVSHSSVPRAAGDAVADSDNNASTEIYCPEAQAQIKNYGSGAAINVRYALTPTNPASSIARPKGYLAALRQGARFRCPISRGLLQGNEWETVITFESLSGQKYETRIMSDDLVMTKISVNKLGVVGSFSRVNLVAAGGRCLCLGFEVGAGRVRDPLTPRFSLLNFHDARQFRKQERATRKNRFQVSGFRCRAYGAREALWRTKSGAKTPGLKPALPLRTFSRA